MTYADWPAVKFCGQFSNVSGGFFVPPVAVNQYGDLFKVGLLAKKGFIFNNFLSYVCGVPCIPYYKGVFKWLDSILEAFFGL